MSPRRLAVWFLLAALFLGGCSKSGTNARAGVPATRFVHVHGLSVDKTGTLWIATHRGLIKQSGTGWIYASTDRNDYMGFTSDPVSGTMYRSGHPEAGGTLGVESSSDGRAWDHLADVLDPPADFHAMTLSYADPKVMYGWDSGGRGFFISRDRGTTWDRLAAMGLTDPNLLALAAPKTARALFAATPTGLFRSSDEGATFTLVAGIHEAVSAIAGDPADPKHLLAFAQSGMKVSSDGGATWKAASQGIPAGRFVDAIAISPSDPETAYAAVATTLYQTRNGGRSWSMLRSGD